MSQGGSTATDPYGTPQPFDYALRNNLFEQGRAETNARKEAEAAAARGPLGVSQTLTPSGGQYGNHEQYRASIQKWAQANNIDPDALAAILQIESPSGSTSSQSGVGARGLGQVMPATWDAMVKAGTLAPTDDPWSADGSIKAAAAYFAEQYRTFGDYALAAAAYQGGPGAIVNGKARSWGGDGNLTPDQYAARWTQNYQGIKASAPKAGTSGAVPASMSSIWGGGAASVGQEYGVVSPGLDQGQYNYGAAYGLPQGHTGLDIGLKRGTALYMPAGLTGVVEIAGGSGVFKDEDAGDPGNLPGRGELRIRLSNGDLLIMGHTSAINVRVGQQVGAGALVAASGSANGPHLHLEVRRRNANGGYSLVNPREYFGAASGGSSSGLR